MLSCTSGFTEWWSVPGSLCLIKPTNLFALCPLNAVWQTPSRLSRVFYPQWLQSHCCAEAKAWFAEISWGPAGYLISAENVSVLCVSWNEACFVLFIPINKLYLHMQCYECVLHLKPLWWRLHENLFIINWRFVKPGRNKCNLFRVVSVPVDCLVVFSLLLITWLTKLICGLVFVSSAFRQRSCGWKCAGLTSNSLIRHFMHGSSTVSESCWSDVCWRWRPDTPRLIFDLICEPRKTFELVALPESRRELKCCECFTKRSSLNPDYVRMCTRHPDYSVQTVLFHKPEGP